MISNPWLTYDWKGWAVLGEMASVWLLLHPVSVCVCVRGCFCVHLLACALCRGCWAGGDGTGGKEVSHWAEIKETPPTFYLAIFKSSTCKKKKVTPTSSPNPVEPDPRRMWEVVCDCCRPGSRQSWVFWELNCGGAELGQKCPSVRTFLCESPDIVYCSPPLKRNINVYCHKQ